MNTLQPSCYINSLPGLVPTESNTLQTTSIITEDGTLVQSLTNTTGTDVINGAGFNGISSKSIKMYTDPDGSINIHLDGPVTFQEDQDGNVIVTDPWEDDNYCIFISLENAREKWTVFEHTGPIKSFLQKDVVKNPIIYSEPSDGNIAASLYLRISTDQLLLARGTYVVRLYKANKHNNGYTLFKAFTLTAKSDPIQGKDINRRYLNTMNRLGINTHHVLKIFDSVTQTQGSSITPSLINDLYIQSTNNPDNYYRLGAEVLEGETEPQLYLVPVEKPVNPENVVKLNDLVLQDDNASGSYKLDVWEHDNDTPDNTDDDIPMLTLTKI